MEIFFLLHPPYIFFQPVLRRFLGIFIVANMVICIEPIKFYGRPEKLFSLLLTPLLYLTCETGAVDDEDFTVSSKQGNI